MSTRATDARMGLTSRLGHSGPPAVCTVMLIRFGSAAASRAMIASRRISTKLRGRAAGDAVPVLREVRVLEEDDVVVGAGGRDGVPDAGERLLLVVGLEVDLEDADVVGLGQLGVGEDGRELLACLEVAGAAPVEEVHLDDLAHVGVVPRRRPRPELQLQLGAVE